MIHILIIVNVSIEQRPPSRNATLLDNIKHHATYRYTRLTQQTPCPYLVGMAMSSGSLIKNVILWCTYQPKVRICDSSLYPFIIYSMLSKELWRCCHLSYEAKYRREK